MIHHLDRQAEGEIHRPQGVARFRNEFDQVRQRRLALGEALAHLAYLRKRGEVERIVNDDGTFMYRKKSRARSGAEE